jgi:hypothetical protein
LKADDQVPPPKGIYAWLREIVVGGIPLFSLWFINFLAGTEEPYPREVFIWAVVVSGGTLLTARGTPEKTDSLLGGLIWIMKGLSTLVLLAGAFGYALLTAHVVKENITVARTILIIALALSLATAVAEFARRENPDE